MKEKIIEVFIFGIDGKMGAEVVAALPKNWRVAGGRSRTQHDKPTSVDVIIDFSSPELTEEVLDCAKEWNAVTVIATTGHSIEQLKMIDEFSTNHLVYRSGNMSQGIAVMEELLALSKLRLPNADVELIETHHSQKKDAPSGTALMLRNFVGDCPIHSLRCGGVVGTHTVLFALPNETLTITHTAQNRKIFAVGAIEQAKKLLQTI